jgi:hypothetical protein
VRIVPAESRLLSLSSFLLLSDRFILPSRLIKNTTNVDAAFFLKFKKYTPEMLGDSLVVALRDRRDTPVICY